MYEIHADPAKNRIYITLGAIESGDGENLLRDIGVETEKLVNPFTCIADIRQFTILDRGESIWADRALKALSDAGMVRAVRVTGQKSPYSEKKEKYGYIVSLSATPADAEKVLDDYENLS